MSQTGFAYGLVRMLNRKLEREMYRFVLSRAFLSHAIAESLNFENELRGEGSRVSILSLMHARPVCARNIEHNCALGP